MRGFEGENGVLIFYGCICRLSCFWHSVRGIVFNHSTMFSRPHLMVNVFFSINRYQPIDLVLLRRKNNNDALVSQVFTRAIQLRLLVKSHEYRSLWRNTIRRQYKTQATYDKKPLPSSHLLDSIYRDWISEDRAFISWQPEERQGGNSQVSEEWIMPQWVFEISGDFRRLTHLIASSFLPLRIAPPNRKVITQILRLN